MASQNINLMISALEDVSLSRYFAVVAFTLCMYDWILLIGDEYELVGKSRLSLGKVLYYFSRFTTPIGLAFALYHLSPFRGELSEQFCVIFIFICPMMEMVCFFASYWLIMLRLVALYKSRPIFVWLLYIALFASYLSTFGLLLRAQLYYSGSIIYSDEVQVCISPGRASTIAAVFYAPLAFDIAMFLLTVYHAWKDYRSHSDPAVLPLLRVMYRDGAVSCSIMVAARIWNIIIYAVQPLTRTFLGVYMLWAAITILSCRIYLNVVRIARSKDMERPRLHSTTSKVHSFSTTSSPTAYSPSKDYSPTRSRRDDLWQSYHSPDDSSPTNLLPGRRFPIVVGRPIPIIRTPTVRTIESDHFYSSYFRDEFALDHLNSHENGKNTNPV